MQSTLVLSIVSLPRFARDSLCGEPEQREPCQHTTVRLPFLFRGPRKESPVWVYFVTDKLPAATAPGIHRSARATTSASCSRSTGFCSQPTTPAVRRAVLSSFVRG